MTARMPRWYSTQVQRSHKKRRRFVLSGFLYFLPGEISFSDSLLAKFGIEHIRDRGDSLQAHQVIRGPQNQPGVIVGNGANWTPSDVKWSDKLEWKTFPKTQAAGDVPGPALCCWRKGELPGPGDLARREQLTGEFLTMADGKDWLVPNARRWSDGQFLVAVPRTIDVDDETGGFIYGDVLPAYRAIWEHANNYWSGMVEAASKTQPGEDATFTIENPMQLIVDALAANYRVSAREMGVLGAIDDQMAGKVASVLIDSKGMQQLEKKTANDTGNG